MNFYHSQYSNSRFSLRERYVEPFSSKSCWSEHRLSLIFSLTRHHKMRMRCVSTLAMEDAEDNTLSFPRGPWKNASPTKIKQKPHVFEACRQQGSQCSKTRKGRMSKCLTYNIQRVHYVNHRLDINTCEVEPRKL